MEFRLGVIAGSMAELKSKLQTYQSGAGGIEEFYQGEIKRDKEALAVFADEDMARGIEAWVAKGKYGKLLELWVKGLSFDWDQLYGDAKPRRISLPTYPFAKELYWIEGVRTERPPVRIGEKDRPVGSVADRAIATFAVARGDSRAQVEEYVTEYFSEKLKLPRAQINPHVELSSYGLELDRGDGFPAGVRSGIRHRDHRKGDAGLRDDRGAHGPHYREDGRDRDCC